MDLAFRVWIFGFRALAFGGKKQSKVRAWKFDVFMAAFRAFCRSAVFVERTLPTLTLRVQVLNHQVSKEVAANSSL